MNGMLLDLTDTAYPAVRRVMGPDRIRLDDAELEGLLAEVFPGVAPDNVEDLMHDLQTFGRRTAPLARKALPGALQGAAMGASAGPAGIVAGAVGGGVAGIAGRPGRSTTRSTSDVTGGLGRVTTSGPAPMPGQSQAPQPCSSPPVARLVAFLVRPETMQAVAALLMCSSGRPAVKVGPAAVPPTEFIRALANLAADAAAALDGKRVTPVAGRSYPGATATPIATSEWADEPSYTRPDEMGSDDY
jgi:hypothetical protein